MPKKKGEPVTPVTHPDPKVWKWCKHPECQRMVKRIEGWDNPETKQKLMREKPYLCSIYAEDFCWKHLSKKSKEAYREKIEKHLVVTFSLCGGNLMDSDLSNINCSYVDFRRTLLRRANLKNASLSGCDFRETDLVGIELERAYIFDG
jgi:hypothetical protein